MGGTGSELEPEDPQHRTLSLLRAEEFLTQNMAAGRVIQAKTEELPKQDLVGGRGMVSEETPASTRKHLSQAWMNPLPRHWTS